MKFTSTLTDLGTIHLPAFSSIRWMMMPFDLKDVEGTVPEVSWHPAIKKMLLGSKLKKGKTIGYLTIDESKLKAGEIHRRPGLHVDGLGGWGASPWAANGMVCASSHMGCQAWEGEFEGEVDEDGGCEKLSLSGRYPTPILGGRHYRMGGMTVHETLPAKADQERQFVRISMPSDAPWYENYTRNPLGVKPAGPILPARKQMEYRP